MEGPTSVAISYVNELSLVIQPCLHCHAPMQCYNTAQFTPDAFEPFYVMVCTQCSYGPLSAFATCQEAILHWNARKDGTPCVRFY